MPPKSTCAEIVICSGTAPNPAHWDRIEKEINLIGLSMMSPSLPCQIGSYASVEDTLIGGCNALVLVNSLNIGSLWITPAWRRQGIACRLLDAVIANGSRLGANRVHIETEIDTAKLLYERYGFLRLADFPGIVPGYVRTLFSISL